MNNAGIDMVKLCAFVDADNKGGIKRSWPLFMEYIPKHPQPSVSPKRPSFTEHMPKQKPIG